MSECANNKYIRVHSIVDICEGNILFNVRISIRENNSIIILSTAIEYKNRLEIMIMIIPTAYS